MIQPRSQKQQQKKPVHRADNFPMCPPPNASATLLAADPPDVPAVIVHQVEVLSVVDVRLLDVSLVDLLRLPSAVLHPHLGPGQGIAIPLVLAPERILLLFFLPR